MSNEQVLWELRREMWAIGACTLFSLGKVVAGLIFTGAALLAWLVVTGMDGKKV
jgi:hypothetical protein